jgi:hypothetical protein
MDNPTFTKEHYNTQSITIIFDNKADIAANIKKN